MTEKQKEMNVVIDNVGKRIDMEKETENQAETEVVVLDSDGSDSHVDGGEGRAAKTVSSCPFCAFRRIPPFLQKIYEMLGNDEISSLVSWNCTGTSFVIKNCHLFAANVLPIYFRHNNFQSFVTQLNSYGFKKISWEQWEYRNEYFRKGERDLLRNIKRRDYYSRRIQLETKTSVATSSCSGNMEKELTILMKEQHQVKAEIMKLKHNQQNLEEKLASLENQSIRNKEDQNRMMSVAQKFLKKQKDSSSSEIPMLEESQESDQKKGKRKLEAESATIKDNQGEMLLDEEEMAKHEPNTLISLADLFGEPSLSGWVEYVTEMQEKANCLKS